MKLEQIITERRREQTVPVEVEYEYEYENADGDYETADVVIELDVHVTPDAYGTGDSPTSYDVDFKKAYYKEGGKPFDWRKLDKKSLKWIEDKAVERAHD